MQGWDRRSVMVTGGAGFIGSALVRHLLEDTESAVVNVDKLTYAGNLASIPQADGHPRYAFEQIDIAAGAALRRAFARHRPDAVINLAAESHVDRSIDAPADFITTNVVGTFTLLQEALRYWQGLEASERGRFRLLHVSTDEVYGSLGNEGRFSETSVYAPNSPYSASKASSDHLVRAWGETYELPTLITNCSNNYGPYQFPEKLIPLIIIRGLNGDSLPVYGDGGHVRDWLHVEDHVRALALVLQQGVPGETYNVGASCERTNLAVVELLCELLDKHAPAKSRRRDAIAFVPDRSGHDRRYAIDAGKIERELGWRAQVAFEAGLESTVRWYLDNRAWWQAILDRGYRPDRLGLGSPLAAE